MAFELDGWARGSNAQTKAPSWHTYKSDTDLQAAIITIGYFNDRANGLNLEDIIYLRGTDLGGWFRVDALTPDVDVKPI